MNRTQQALVAVALAAGATFVPSLVDTASAPVQLRPVFVRPAFDTPRDAEVRWIGPANDGQPSSPTTVTVDPSVTCPTFC